MAQVGLGPRIYKAMGSISYNFQFADDANKRGAGRGGFAILWRAGRAWPALPDRERSAKWQPLNLSTMAAKSQGGRSETPSLAGFGL